MGSLWQLGSLGIIPLKLQRICQGHDIPAQSRQKIESLELCFSKSSRFESSRLSTVLNDSTFLRFPKRLFTDSDPTGEAPFNPFCRWFRSLPPFPNTVFGGFFYCSRPRVGGSSGEKWNPGTAFAAPFAYDFAILEFAIFLGGNMCF